MRLCILQDMEHVSDLRNTEVIGAQFLGTKEVPAYIRLQGRMKIGMAVFDRSRSDAVCDGDIRISRLSPYALRRKPTAPKDGAVFPPVFKTASTANFGLCIDLPPTRLLPESDSRISYAISD